jgi:hypothetical protein
VKLSSMIWLTWRQHRWSIVGVAAIALFAAYALIVAESDLHHVLDSMPITGFYGLMAQLGFGALIGMFWGAPLIARELEERTYFVAWGQDVSPVKWLRGKVIVLGVLALLLGALIGAGDGYVGATRSWSGFEANPLLQAGYAILGLALGVLVGLLTRHVVTAIAGTLVFFTLTRFLLSLMRDYYLPPERVVARWDNRPVVPERALELPGGLVGSDLEPVSPAGACVGVVNESGCMRRTAQAIGTYVDYQPIERLTAFQIIEFVVCALITAALLWLAFWRLRHGGWKPSRSHRRIAPSVTAVPTPVMAGSASLVGAGVSSSGGAGFSVGSGSSAPDVSESEPESEPEVEVEPEREIETPAEPEVESEPQDEPQPEPEAEPEPELEPEPEPEPEPEAESQPESESESESDTTTPEDQSAPDTGAKKTEG